MEDQYRAAAFRMARSGLKLSVREISEYSKVSPTTINKLENAGRLLDRTLSAIRKTYEELGVVFVYADYDENMIVGAYLENGVYW